MAITLENLQARIAQIQQELAEVSRDLEQLAVVPDPRTKVGWPAGIRGVDRAGWKAWFDEWFQHIGITTQPVGAESLQEMMLQEGVRPEENLLSGGIVAMREE
ncbi:MAG: hypothetical protein M5U01_41100 [Ardenticatenaceae bacterium]|nr:hypothetical protein [Ardenticatenaceae bacterium]